MFKYRIFEVSLFFIIILLPFYSFAVEVSNVSQLQTAINNANSGGDKQIIIQAGTYHLNGVYLRLEANGITVTGKTGKRGDVVLDGDYVTTEIFQIVASNVTIKDLTLKRAWNHPIHIFPESSDVVGTLIKNVYIIDPGQQAIKINQNASDTLSVNYGTVQQSKIELTATGRIKVLERNGSCYTGGVDAHHATGWEVADNVIVGFWCETSLSEHGVHFWSFSQDTIVERNKIINCDRGIGFGLGSSGHVGGIIRNNMIYHDSGHSKSDVGISLENASSAQVYNNTIYHEHSYANGIEYRFSGTNGGIIRNNLTNKVIASRDGGTASLSHNVTNAQSSWFKGASSGDLHLVYKVNGVVDSGIFTTGLQDDFDQEKRPMGTGFDIGADEFTVGAGSTSAVSSWLMLLLQE